MLSNLTMHLFPLIWYAAAAAQTWFDGWELTWKSALGLTIATAWDIAAIFYRGHKNA